MKTDRSILKKSATMLVLIVSAAFMLEACAKEPLEGGGMITMTTKANKVWFTVEGSEDIAIDWGDGKKSSTKDAISDLDSRFVFTHDYSNEDIHNIVITGSNMTKLYCGGIELTSLDVSRCMALDDLICSGNKLTSLDVSRNTALNNLECNYNQIAKLDVSKNTALWALYCVGNQLTTAALNDLFRTLPDYSKKDYKGGIFIHAKRGGNIIGNLDCDRSIAEKRGWRFMTIR